ncbi:hypothetical protein M569_12258, partial [Genlisea aurea]
QVERRSSWEVSAEKYLNEDPTAVKFNEPAKLETREKVVEKKDEGDEESEIINDPRWPSIKNKFNKVKFVSEKPEFRKWNKQEAWGRNTWKEAQESTLPKIVGEGIYGVAPVLAALSAGRREFYALYVQDGMEAAWNNKKRKDKKGLDKILKIAEKVGLNQREASKHDLNMMVDNRPHQGLVLDASPLEMMSIKELHPVSSEEQKGGPLWVALDEITDPQNLGAIIRSCYFFGASGVVVCAKNSAPLSGVVSKASAGSVELMELRSCKNMMQFLTLSSGNGWRILGASLSTRAVTLNKVVPGEQPTVLVLGNEGVGLRALVERSCTELIRIPGNAADFRGNEEDNGLVGVESLNVSVAAGVLLNHLAG